MPLLVFAVIVPALGLWLGMFMLDHFDPFRVFVYSYSAMLLGTTVIWLLLRARVGGCAGLFEGVFLGGVFFAVAIGLMLIPFTLLMLAATLVSGGFCLIFVALGLAPFACAFAMVIQIRQIRARSQPSARRATIRLLALALPFVASAVLQTWAFRLESTLRDEISSAHGPALDAALARLFHWGAVVDVDLLFEEHARRVESNPPEAGQIERAFRDETGESMLDSPPTPGPVELYLSAFLDRPTRRWSQASRD